ncbi:MAG: hypothetical protein MJ230_01180 [bacterium]|nr:hypothetical protein [bacterium]
MTEEMNNEIKEEKHECKCGCWCCSETFKDFLKIAVGSFVGVFLALSLFAALHKPPMRPFPPCPRMMHQCMPMPCAHHFDRGQRGDFHRIKMEKKNFDKNFPVKVEVEKNK